MSSVQTIRVQTIRANDSQSHGALHLQIVQDLSGSNHIPEAFAGDSEPDELTIAGVVTAFVPLSKPMAGPIWGLRFSSQRHTLDDQTGRWTAACWRQLEADP
jgi:hypothetical protein